MSTYSFASFQIFNVLPFDPLADRIDFSGTGLSAADLNFQVNDHGGDFQFSFFAGGKLVTLLVDPTRLSSMSMFSGENASIALIGDNSSGVRDDDFPNAGAGLGGNDVLIGLGGADSMSGGAGNDVFYTFRGQTINNHVGNDTLDGGTGVDRLAIHDLEGPTVNIQTASVGSFTSSSQSAELSGSVVVNLLTGVATLPQFDGTNQITVTLTLSGIENVIGSDAPNSITGNNDANVLVGGYGNDTLTGNAGNDILMGGFGNDNLNGGDGNDVLRGQQGADTIQGGAGNDTIRGYGRPGDVMDGGAGIDTLEVQLRHSSLLDATNVENMVVLGGVNVLAGGGMDLLLRGDAPDSRRWDEIFDLYLTWSEGNNAANSLTGSGGEDFFSGGGGNDTLDGLGGFDIAVQEGSNAAVTATFDASTGIGSMTIAGGGNIDTLKNIEGVAGGYGNDLITGGAGNELLYGNDGNDTLIGGAGNDTIFGRAGNDSMDGGLGNADWLALSGAHAGVTVSLLAGLVTNGGENNDVDTVTGFENLAGSEFDDDLTGNAGANIIYGAYGDDLLDGGAGNDSLDGGDGFDSVDYSDASGSVNVDLLDGTATGAAGEDTLERIEGVIGSDFNDTIIGGNTALIVDAGLGNDSIVGNSVLDAVGYSEAVGPVTINLQTGIVTGHGTDTLSGIEMVVGSLKGDTFTGRTLSAGEIEILAGNEGNDTITGGGGAGTTIVWFGAANVGVNATMTAGNVAYTGGGLEGEDVITVVDGMWGSEFNDTLTGDTADNELAGFFGNDGLNGGGGNDWAVYFDSSDPVFANLGTASVTLDGTAMAAGTALDGIDTNGSTIDGVQAGTDLLVNIENLRGGTGGDRLAGSDSANILEGGDGNDTLQGGKANDTLDGGDGISDQVDYSSSPNAVVVNLGATPLILDNNLLYGDATLAGGTAYDGFDTDTLTGGVQSSVDAVTGFERVRGTSQGDYIRGADTSEFYTGRMGDPSNTYLLGNNGNSGTVDTIDGGSASDGDFDTINYSGFSTGVYVDLRDGQATVMTAPFNFGAQIATFTNIDGVIGTGNADSLSGGSDSRTFNGSRFETFQGGAGNDTIQGRGGIDWVDIFNPSVNVNIDLSQQFGGTQNHNGANDGFNGRDSYQGIDGIRILGTAVTNDTLFGGDQGDREYFLGGAGNDFIVGDEGFDIVMYMTSPNAVYVNLSLSVAYDGFVTNDGDGSNDSLFEIEGISGSDFNDTLIGAAGGEEIYEEFEGRAGNDLIDGNDSFVPQMPGQAVITYDRATFHNALEGVFVNLDDTTRNNGTITLTGGHASDGYGGTDTLIGIEGARGSRFDDTLLGGDSAHDGFEFFEGAAGNDLIDGGSGNDWILFDFAYAGVSVDLGSNTVLDDGWGDVDTLVSIEHASGSDFDDLIVGSSAANVLHGGDGDDTLRGGAGNDQLIGNDYGDDQFDSPESDWADFSDATTALGASLITGIASSTTTGLDTLAFIANLRGGSGSDTLIGNAGNNWLQGGGGNDLLIGGAGNDVASYAEASGNLSITIGAGTWTATDGFGNTDALVGIEGVAGGSGNDTLTGNAYDNFFDGGAGNDLISGGAGLDWLDYSRSESQVTVNLLAGTSSGGMGADAISGIEAVRGSRFADIFVSANPGAGLIEFYAPNGGNDTVTGSTTAGLTVLVFRDLQASFDTTNAFAGFGVDLRESGSGLGSGILRVEHEWDIGTIDFITYTGIDGVYGGRWNDSMVGNSEDNWFNGGHGADVLDAGTDGFDILSYRDALNPIIANLTGAALTRNYTFADGTSIGSVTVASMKVLDGNGGDDQLYIDALAGDFEQLEGGAYNDTVAGSGVNNVFFGHEGEDWLAGGLGLDTLDGGAGVDRVFFLGAGSNTSSGAVVDLQAGTAVSLDGNDVLISIEGVQGTAAGDSILGRDDYEVHGMFSRDLFEYYQPLRGADTIDGGGNGWGQTDILDLNGFTSGVNLPTVGVNANLGTSIVSNDGFGFVDKLTANTIDHLQGNNFNDTLVGGSTSRTFTGALFESFRGNAGADSINGMGGEDRADYNFTSAAVVINLGSTARSLAGTPYASLLTIAGGRALDGQDSGTGTGVQPYLDTLVGIEHVRGTAFSDFFFGGGSHNASATNVDRFYDYEAFEGQEGNDFIDGGAGNDVAIYQRATSGIIVNLGADPLVVGPYTVASGKAHDGYGTVDTLLSIEVVVGSDFDDFIQGGTGNDQFRAGAGNDTMHGGAGNDRLNYSSSPNGVFVDLANGTATDGFDSDLLTGGVQAWSDSFTGFEAVRGSHHDDTLLGSTGDDTLEGLGGADLLNGGEGIDTVTYRFEEQHGSSQGVIVNLGAADFIAGPITVQGGHALDGYDTLNGGPGRGLDTLVGFENIGGSSFSDTLIGGAGDNVIEGELGNDSIDGGAGNDTATYRNAVGGILVNFVDNTVSGAAGNDTLAGIETVEGSSFNDSYTIAGAASVISEALDGGIDTVSGSDDYTLGANLETLVLLGIGDLAGTGNDGNNTITGNNGNNSLDGGLGNDSMAGGLGNDVYFVNAAADVVTEASVAGAGSADEVRVTGINYTLGANLENLTIADTEGRSVLGNAVANIIRGGSGRDTLAGGAGNDTYIIDDTVNGAREISGIGTGTGLGPTIVELAGGGTDTVISSVSNIRPLAPNIENIQLAIGAGSAIIATGNGANNLIVGNELPNNLYGGAGNDTLQGGAGNDKLYGNDGNDSLLGGLGNDTLYGGNGNDQYVIDSGSDTVVETGGSAADFAEQTSASFNQRASGQGLDSIRMAAVGDQEFLGNNRNSNIFVKDDDEDSQTIRGGGGRDTISSGGGDDIIEINDSLSTVNAGSGIDTIQLRFNYVMDVSLEVLEFLEPETGPGNYVGIGNIHANTLTGNSGDNTLDGRAGNDSINGGAGFDQVSYANEALAVTIHLGEGIGGSSLTGGAGNDTLVSIEDAAGGKGNDTITGNNDGNVLFGVGGNDSLIGLGGDDTLEGGLGIDTLIGGAGADSYRVESTLDRVDEDTLTGAIDTVLSTVNFSLDSQNVIGEVENLVLLGTALSGIGNDLGNSITGNKGNNTLDGGLGNDVLTGGLGNDTYVVNHAGDVVVEALNEGTDTVTSKDLAAYTIAANIENLTLTLASGASLTGNSANNSLTGGAGNDTLDGMAGNDTLNGGGGLGDDLFRVDSQGDVLVDGGASTGDTVLASTHYSFAAFAFIEAGAAAVGTDNINITGNAANNTIFGNDGNNSLAGGAGNDSLFDFGLGNDTLDGGLGNDTMLGGDGDDTYVVDRLETTTLAVLFDSILLDSGGNDTVISSVSISLSNLNDQNRLDLDNVVLTGTSNLFAVGNSISNRLTGNSGNNELNGHGGIDTMVGLGGNDAYGVDNAGDVVIEVATAAGGVDTIVITAAIDYALTEGAGVEHLVYDRKLTEHVPAYTGGTLTGTSGNNILAGADGNDTLIGLGGNDSMQGDNPAVDSDQDGNDSMDGGAGNDSLVGNGGNDTLDGGLGNDTLIGGVGDDTYVVNSALDVIAVDTSGNDTVRTSVGTTLNLSIAAGSLENVILQGTVLNAIGNASKNSLTGNDSNNSLSGGAGDDTLIGGLGNDTLEGGAGIDSLDGGTGGSDWASFAAEIAVVQATAGAGTVMIGGVAADVIAGIENLFGGRGNDELDGDENDNILDGSTGADILVGGAGNDTYVIDVAGDAITDSDGASDSVRASFNHTLGLDFENLALFGPATTGTGNVSGNRIEGNAANNTLTGLDGDDTLIGAAGNDSLAGGNQVDTADYTATTGAIVVNLTLAAAQVTGGAGTDNLSGIEIVVGGSGNDTFTGSAGAETLRGGAGSDWVFFSGGEGVEADVFGANTEDTFEQIENLRGTAGNDTLTGCADDNILQGGLGNDILDGEELNDWASYADATGAVTVTLNDTQNGSADGAMGDDVLISIENVLGGSGNDSLTGDVNANILDGGLGNDTLTGGDGGDTFIVNALGDRVIEGALGGSDEIQSAVSIDLRTEAGALSQVVHTDHRANIEDVTLTGTGTASVFGNAQNNALTGNSVANTLSGGAGDDTLNGGAGADSLIGGEGNDWYRVDNIGDKVDEAAGGGGIQDSVFSTVTYSLSGTAAAVEELYLEGALNINGTGNAIANNLGGNSGNNSLIGLAGDDDLRGMDGDDTLDGGLGNDYLWGGYGNDTFLVDSAADAVVEHTAGGGTDTVRATLAAGQAFTLGANIETLILEGLATAHSSGTGNNSDNLLVGNAGNNLLDGGLGNDTLRGGAGNDTYVIDSPDDVVDETISGSTGTADHVVVSGFDYTLGTNVEHLTFDGGEGYTGTGNLLGNSMTGGAGNDSLFGETGNDTLDGAAGEDVTTGGLGNDMHVIDDVDDVVIELAGGGTDTVASANLSLDLNDFANFENLALLGSYAGTLTGNASANLLTGSSGSNTLLGGAGNDTLNGLGGNDRLDGGDGIDSMIGGTGDDTYVTNVAGDVIVEVNLGGGIDTVIAGAGNSGAALFTIAARPELEHVELAGTVLNAIGNLKDNSLTGTAGNNSLAGGAGNDTLIGGAGNDTLQGDAGGDSMAGGADNDLYFVEHASDIVVENPGEGTSDTVSTSLNGYTLLADFENLILTGTAVSGTGNTDGNQITAGTGNGTLNGLDGNDTLNGGAGNDTLLGGIGDDVFIFDQADGSVQGGAGEDTVKVAALLGSAAAPFDIGVVASRFDSIDVIDITGTGNNAILINLDDVAAITDGSEELRTLRIEGNRGLNDAPGDFVRSTDTWTLNGLRQVGESYYVEYSGQFNTLDYTLLVHTDITQQFTLA